MFSLANHEKSKKHKENLAVLKLVLQEEEAENIAQPLSDSDSSYSKLSEDLILDSNSRQHDTIGDIHSSSSDTHSDKGDDTNCDMDGHSCQGDRHSSKEQSRHKTNDITKQLSSNDHSRIVENDSTLSASNRDEEIKSCESDVDNDDDFLLLAQNKKRQKESQLLDDLEDEIGLVSVTVEKSEEHSTSHQRYKSFCT